MEWIIRVILLITLAFSAVMLLLCRSGRITAEEDQRKDLRLIAVTSLCLLILEAAYPFLADFGSRLPFPSGDRLLLLACYLIPWAIIGREILSEAFTEIRRGGITGENFLMAVASVGALILAVLDNGEFREAVAVLLFYRIGEWLEDYASEKSRSHIRGLMELRPDRASVLRGGIWTECDPAEVAVGETVRVLPGERIPMDGIVTAGASALNTSALTGGRLLPETKFSAAVSVSPVCWRSARGVPSGNPPPPGSWLSWRTPMPTARCCFLRVCTAAS